MVTLNTLLIVGSIAAVGASVATVAFILLLGVYLGVREVKKATRTCADEDEGGGGIYTIPIGGGGTRTITQADIDQARQAIMQHRQGQGVPAAPGEEKKADEAIGNYI